MATVLEPDSPATVLDQRREALVLTMILAVATGLRFWQLGAACFWYDEVITMRVARAGSPAAVLERLGQLDTSRAPLHPLVLSGWLQLMGISEAAGRSLSAVCGVITVCVAYLLGRAAYSGRVALWSAWLTALCPPLVYYSREARMYSWLVMLTALSWLLFLSFRRRAGWARCVSYTIVLVALAYSHPVGLFMIVAHAVGYLLVRSALALTFRRWIAVQISVLLWIAPSIAQYMNRSPDYPLPRYGLSFLLAVPLEYIGGNKWTFAVCLCVVSFGLFRPASSGRRWVTLDHPTENLTFLVWLAIPPLLLYTYSYLATPLFGPPRYHLFIAPAYLILLASGLAKLPGMVRWGFAALALGLSLMVIHAGIYAQPVKADWKGVSTWLETQYPVTESRTITLVVHPSDPRFPREEIEAARYYMAARCRVVPGIEDADITRDDVIIDAVCRAAPAPTLTTDEGSQSFVGVTLIPRKLGR